MPITDSAKKALRQSAKRKVRNLRRANTYKAEFKKLEKMAKALPSGQAGGQNKEVQNQLAKVYQSLDKAAKTGVIKNNKAARLKSAASKLIIKK